MLRDTFANGECRLSVLKTERLACEEREALLPRQRLIIDVLRDAVANGECRLRVVKDSDWLVRTEPERSHGVTRPNNPRE